MSDVPLYEGETPTSGPEWAAHIYSRVETQERLFKSALRCATGINVSETGNPSRSVRERGKTKRGVRSGRKHH